MFASIAALQLVYLEEQRRQKQCQKQNYLQRSHSLQLCSVWPKAPLGLLQLMMMFFLIHTTTQLVLVGPKRHSTPIPGENKNDCAMD